MIQNLEDTTVRVVVREVGPKTILHDDELVQLFSIFRGQYLLCCSWGQVSPTDPKEKQDPNRPTCETYRVDMDRFALMLGALTDWTKGSVDSVGINGRTNNAANDNAARQTRHPPLVTRLFHLLDDEGDGFVGFREFAVAVGIMTRGDVADKMRLLFEIHLDLEDELSAASSGLADGSVSPTKSDATEVAEEAADYVEEALELEEDDDDDDGQLEEGVDSDAASGVVNSVVNGEDIRNGNKGSENETTIAPLSSLFAGENEIPPPEIVILEPSSTRRLTSTIGAAAEAPVHVYRDPEEYRTYRTRRRGIKSDSKSSFSVFSPQSLHSLPPLNQRGFIELLKTLYDMTSGMTMMMMMTMMKTRTMMTTLT